MKTESKFYRLTCIFGIALILLFEPSCGLINHQVSNSGTTSTFKIQKPDKIIYYSKGKNTVITDKKQVNKILALTDQRVSHLCITALGSWPDTSIIPILTSNDTLEFDYSSLQASYIKEKSTPRTAKPEKPKIIYTKTQYTKLYFPLSDITSSSSSSEENTPKHYSICFYSLGDPNITMARNGKPVNTVFEIGPIDSPNVLAEYLNNIRN